MEQGLLIVSYGTAEPAARRQLGRLEDRLAAAWKGGPVLRAVSSPAVRRILADRGVGVLSPARALDRLAEAGVRRAAVLPTHLMPGSDYTALCRQVQQSVPRFDRLRLGRPLLEDPAAVTELTGWMAASWLPQTGVLLLVGHGGRDGGCMQAFCRAAEQAGGGRILTGMLRGRPDLNRVLAELHQRGNPPVTLRPLMLGAGTHARRELAGPGPDSWASRLAGAGIACRCRLEGLAEDPRVERLYVRQLEQLSRLL